jgi:adenosylcobyric acid synthase
LEIVVLRLPSLSNFSDLDPLEAEPSVGLRWLRPGQELGQPDAVVVPGSKQTLRDLSALRSSGLDHALARYVAEGGQVFALCGGAQMLGREVCDPEGLEGGGTMAGLNLLPLRTVFGGAKVRRQRRCRALWPAVPAADLSPVEVEGFELHRGLSSLIAVPSEASCLPLCEDPNLGWVQPVGDRDGLVAGTYLHGIYESGPWRRRWLNMLRGRKGLPPLSEVQPHHGRQRDILLDRLAEAFERHVHLDPLLEGDG